MTNNEDWQPLGFYFGNDDSVLPTWDELKVDPEAAPYAPAGYKSEEFSSGNGLTLKRSIVTYDPTEVDQDATRRHYLAVKSQRVGEFKFTSNGELKRVFSIASPEDSPAMPHQVENARQVILMVIRQTTTRYRAGEISIEDWGVRIWNTICSSATSLATVEAAFNGAPNESINKRAKELARQKEEAFRTFYRKFEANAFTPEQWESETGRLASFRNAMLQNNDLS